MHELVLTAGPLSGEHTWHPADAHQRFHDLRHACASLLLAQGLDLKVILEVLGHSTITITANLYAHVAMGLKRQASSRMDALLGDLAADHRHPARRVTAT